MPTTTKPAAAADPVVAVPDYEIKVYLDAKALDVEFEPHVDLERVLHLSKSNRKISMQFLDSRPPKIHREGWGVRVRKFEGQQICELTFKRRYPLGNLSLADALTAAAEDGFDASERDYDAQVEWGYQKQTLSFSMKKEFTAKGYREMNLPTSEIVREAAIDALPGKLNRWKNEGWARGILATGELFGPVLGKRWTGQWAGPGKEHGPELSLEVWLIKAARGKGYEPVVELSFKEDKQSKAAAARDKLLTLMRKQHWLLEDDVLKTQMIFDRY